MINSLFVIACYYDGSNTSIYDCVESIRSNHSTCDIVIVDSDSPNKSYFDLKSSHDVKILDIKNKNYDVGAYWAAFKQFPDYEYYYMIHDSMILKNNLCWVERHNFCSLRYFQSSDVIGGVTYIAGRTDAYKYILQRTFRRGIVDFDMYGFDSVAQRDWVIGCLKKTKYHLPKLWLSLFGPIFFCRREILTMLEAKEIMNILPSNKIQQMAMERLLGIVLTQEGVDISNSVQGDNYHAALDSKGVQKIIYRRV